MTAVIYRCLCLMLRETATMSVHVLCTPYIFTDKSAKTGWSAKPDTNHHTGNHQEHTYRDRVVHVRSPTDANKTKQTKNKQKDQSTLSIISRFACDSEYPTLKQREEMTLFNTLCSVDFRTTDICYTLVQKYVEVDFYVSQMIPSYDYDLSNVTTGIAFPPARLSREHHNACLLSGLKKDPVFCHQ